MKNLNKIISFYENEKGSTSKRLKELVRAILTEAVKKHGRETAMKIGQPFIKVKEWNTESVKEVVEAYNVTFEMEDVDRVLTWDINNIHFKIIIND